MAENSIGRIVWCEKLILIFSTECITSINRIWSLKAFAKKLEPEVGISICILISKTWSKVCSLHNLYLFSWIGWEYSKCKQWKGWFIIWSLKWHKWTLPHFIIISGCCVGTEVSVGMMGVLLYFANSTVWMPIAATS